MSNMSLRQITRSGLLMLSFAFALPAVAEMPGMKGKQNTGDGTMQMSEMMHDMANGMVSMAGEMDYGNLDSAQQKQMAERMRNMGLMMDNMSNMMGKGMMDKTQQKQMNDMRKQMDQMMKGSVGTKQMGHE